MERIPREVDVLIIGNGPSALILSYILSGHIPSYNSDSPHPDPILHEKLKNTEDLLNLDVDYSTEHFLASRFPYSTQALPVNVLLDTLIRPYGETEDEKSCVRWEWTASRAVTHLVIGDSLCAGGQWADNPVQASWDIGTLSYARMLSLPGYSFDDYCLDTDGHTLPFASRPTRRQVAAYLASYPTKVGIAHSFVNDSHVSGVRRENAGFFVNSHDIRCKHLVLASGTFNHLIPPRALLQPLTKLPSSPKTILDHPLLVIGSGFSAADVIISTPASQSVLHIFKWNPNNHPSPLRGCHQQAYPEYAGVYRRMKIAALSSSTSRDKRPRARRRSSTFDRSRDWDSSYEGMPNTEIIDVEPKHKHAVIKLRNTNGDVLQRCISGLAHVVGRRGDVDFLEPQLLHELNLQEGQLISGQTLRQAAQDDLEVTRNVFIVGSLTGDSLIRFAYGSCTFAAGLIARKLHGGARSRTFPVANGTTATATCCAQSASLLPAMNGLDGHASPYPQWNQPLDGRELDGQLDSNKYLWHHRE